MAGFGFSLGDVVTCSKLAVSAYSALKSAREDFEGLTLELLSLNTTLKALAEEATSPDSIINLAPLQRQKSLQELLENCKNGLVDLHRLVSKYPSLGSGDKQKIIERIRFAARSKQAPRDKLAIHTASINIFLTSLTHSSLGRLELQLRRVLRGAAAGASEVNAFRNGVEDGFDGAWLAIGRDLALEGVTEKQVVQYQEHVKVYLRYLIGGGEPVRHMRATRGDEAVEERKRALDDVFEKAKEASERKALEADKAAIEAAVNAKYEQSYAAARKAAEVEAEKARDKQADGYEKERLKRLQEETLRKAADEKLRAREEAKRKAGEELDKKQLVEKLREDELSRLRRQIPLKSTHRADAPPSEEDDDVQRSYRGISPGLRRLGKGSGDLRRQRGKERMEAESAKGSKKDDQLLRPSDGIRRKADNVKELMGLLDHMFDLDHHAVAAEAMDVPEPLESLSDSLISDYEANSEEDRPLSAQGMRNQVSKPVSKRDEETGSHPQTTTYNTYNDAMDAYHEAREKLQTLVTKGKEAQRSGNAERVSDLKLHVIPEVIQRLRDVGAVTVTCDACDWRIDDIHYHCGICDNGDYDLCEDCYRSGKGCYGTGHALVKCSAVEESEDRIWEKHPHSDSVLDPEFRWTGREDALV